MDTVPRLGVRGPTLPSLELFGIEAICGTLELRDRINLTTCCKVLEERPDITSSPELWGDLEVGSAQLRLQCRREALLGWLTRRRAGLRRLRLLGRVDNLAPVLLGAPLVQLEVVDNTAFDEGGDATLDLLSGLTALTRLEVRGCSLERVPRGLPALRALASLGLRGNSGLGRWQADAPFLRLGGLTSLTRLDIGNCGLQCLPSSLSSLTSLADLDLSSNKPIYDNEAGHDRALGACGDAAFAPLQHLATLTRLDVSWISLRSLPPQLTALTRLRDLSIWGNHVGGAVGGEQGPVAEEEEQAAFEPLCHVTTLTRLDARACGLQSLPRALSALRSLEELNLDSNFALGAGGEASFAPLSHLTAMTRLDLCSCGLLDLPPQLPVLRALAHLRLTGNKFLGKKAELRNTFEHLQFMTGLTLLDISCCFLKRLPQGLSMLTRLEELSVIRNSCLWEAGEAGLQPLQALTALRRLEASHCGLDGSLQPLAALAASGAHVEY